MFKGINPKPPKAVRLPVDNPPPPECAGRLAIPVRRWHSGGMKLPLAAAALASIAAPLHAGPADDARAQLRRIAALDDAGPRLDAVIAYDKRADRAAKAMAATGPLHGRTVLVKDNIETREWPTTAGSLALAGNATGRDAPLVANLRKAGGVVMGKTNLSEWANIRSNGSSSGWSAVGGLVRNPHATDRTACGSSSGSGAAVAAGFAWAAIGTETNGSITCPASVNGVVGFKPSVGLVSRTHVVPISSTQDTPGPMARTVGDAALLLTAIAGADPADPATAAAPAGIDYTVGIDTASLAGVRIGVMRGQIGPRADVRALFEAALDDMRRAGAVLVDVDFQPDPAMSRDSFQVLLFELRDEMGRYLRSLPGADMPRSLADLIAFNAAHPREEMRWFGQEIFEQAEKTTDRPAYRKGARQRGAAGGQGGDRPPAGTPRRAVPRRPDARARVDRPTSSTATISEAGSGSAHPRRSQGIRT